MSYESNSADPIVAATEQLQYGSTDDAASALRTAIRAEADHLVTRSRLKAEHARSMAAVKRFQDNNEAFNDPLVEAAGHRAVIAEQYADLVNSGVLDPAEFQKTYGRVPSEREISTWHLQHCAAGTRGMRAPDKILDDAAKHIEEKFGIRRRITDIDQNRTRRGREMEDASRARRGLPPVDRGEDAPRPRAERDQPATEDALRNLTLAGFGIPNEDEAERADAARRAKVHDVIAERMRSNPRTRAEGDARVQVSRSADESRFAR